MALPLRLVEFESSSTESSLPGRRKFRFSWVTPIPLSLTALVKAAPETDKYGSAPFTQTSSTSRPLTLAPVRINWRICKRMRLQDKQLLARNGPSNNYTRTSWRLRRLAAFTSSSQHLRTISLGDIAGICGCRFFPCVSTDDRMNSLASCRSWGLLMYWRNYIRYQGNIDPNIIAPQSVALIPT